MNILLLTYGTRGDVVPYIALGRGLINAGHAVTICTSTRYKQLIEEHGVSYGYMTDELLQMFETNAGRDSLEGISGVIGALSTMIRLKKQTSPANRKMMYDAWAVTKKVQPDLIFYHPKMLAAVSIAEKLGIPAVMGCLQPMIVPTADFAVPGIPELYVGGWGNRLSYTLVKSGYRIYRGLINDFRQNVLKLPSIKSVLPADLFAGAGPKAVLHGFSPNVVARPMDWPVEAVVCGYWHLDEQEFWTPPRELEEFLDAGDPPVYIGFGSMTGKQAKIRTEMVIQALDKANLRGIIATGWGGLVTSELPENILQVDTVPHDWLFPRMAALIHHGGAGTTAAGLLAGKPSQICPFFGDQFFWGSRVHKLGVGPVPIPQKKLSVDNLVTALVQLTQDKRMLANAENIADKLRCENGVAHTAEVIEKILS